jgi:hypothetical protein
MIHFLRFTKVTSINYNTLYKFDVGALPSFATNNFIVEQFVVIKAENNKEYLLTTITGKWELNSKWILIRGLPSDPIFCFSILPGFQQSSLDTKKNTIKLRASLDVQAGAMLPFPIKNLEQQHYRSIGS